MLMLFPVNDLRGFAIGNTILQFEILKVNSDDTVLAEVRTVAVETSSPSVTTDPSSSECSASVRQS